MHDIKNLKIPIIIPKLLNKNLKLIIINNFLNITQYFIICNIINLKNKYIIITKITNIILLIFFYKVNFIIFYLKFPL